MDDALVNKKKKSNKRLWVIVAAIWLVGLAVYFSIPIAYMCSSPGAREDPLTRVHPSAPQWTPDGSRIVFAHWGSIYAVDQGGSSVTRIHGNEGNAYDSPNISGDGSRIAYHKYGRIREELTSSLDGSNVRKHDEDLGFAPASDSSDVSPNGSQVAFTGVTYTDTQVDWLYLSEYPRDVEVDFRVKLASGYDIRSPRWSPDGKRIAFVKWDLVPNEEDLYSAHIVSLSGPALDTVHQVVDGLGEYENRKRTDRYELDWSPDGVKLLIAGYNSVRVVNSDGSDLRTLVSLRPIFSPHQRHLKASWSPDGSKIAVYNGGGYEGAILTMSPDGSDKRVLALNGNPPSPAQNQAWDPAHDVSTSLSIPSLAPTTASHLATPVAVASITPTPAPILKNSGGIAGANDSRKSRMSPTARRIHLT